MPERRPNVLLVFADQWRAQAMGYAGDPVVQTPNLDRLARESLRLTHAVAGCSVCSPARASLLTGQYPLTHGVFVNDVPLRHRAVSLADAFNRAGYDTAYIGKWHLYGGYWYKPVPAGAFRYGFDDLFLSNNCDLNYQPNHAYFYDQNTGQRKKFNEWEQDGQTRQALEFLDRVKEDEPWSLFVSWHPPHNHKTRAPKDYYGYSAPQKALDLYDYDQVRVREGTTPTEQNRRMMHGYMALVSSIDECFGKIMKKLKERGLDKNTIVVYTADHGDMLKIEDGNVFVKSRAESAASQVPFMIRFPDGRLAGNRNALPFGTLDIMPTLLSMTGIQPPETCHGQDLSQALLSGDESAQESVPMMMSSLDQWRGIATKDWIYSCNPYEAKNLGSRTYNVLYDRRADPGCLNNLFGQPGHADIQAELHKKARAWMARFDDPFMPYGALLKATIDPADIGKAGYVDFWKKSSSGILRRRPIDAAKSWADQKG